MLHLTRKRSCDTFSSESRTVVSQSKQRLAVPLKDPVVLATSSYRMNELNIMLLETNYGYLSRIKS
jgi:hypothetical protein